MSIPRSGPLAAKDELYRQVLAGAITADEYQIAFAQVNAAYSHDRMCENGDRRLAQVRIGGHDLCGLCAVKAYEAHA